MIVVDASVFAFALLDGGRTGDTCRTTLTADDRWIAPEHWMVEVASVIRDNLLGGKITSAHAAEAIAALGQIFPIVPRTQVLLQRTWELHPNVTAYDAGYIAAAEAYGCALITTDSRLARAPGIRCPVNVLS